MKRLIIFRYIAPMEFTSMTTVVRIELSKFVIAMKQLRELYMAMDGIVTVLERSTPHVKEYWKRRKKTIPTGYYAKQTQ